MDAILVIAGLSVTRVYTTWWLSRCVCTGSTNESAIDDFYEESLDPTGTDCIIFGVFSGFLQLLKRQS